jgi:hypothetical protein
MPFPRYLLLIATVLVAAGATVLLGVLLAPRLPAGAGAWTPLVTLAAAATVALLWRRR